VGKRRPARRRRSSCCFLGECFSCGEEEVHCSCFEEIIVDPSNGDFGGMRTLVPPESSTEEAAAKALSTPDVLVVAVFVIVGVDVVLSPSPKSFLVEIFLFPELLPRPLILLFPDEKSPCNSSSIVTPDPDVSGSISKSLEISSSI